MGKATGWHFASVWEQIADAVPDRTALVHGDTRRSWAAYDERAARLATALSGAGIGPDSKVGLYAYNCPEYLEAQYAIFKVRGAAINVNYRYNGDELVYLLENSDSEALVFEAGFRDRIAAIRERLPRLKCLIQIGDGGDGPPLDGAVDYEAAIADSRPMARIPRFPDDVYMLYTGGTTGMPKGVMYRHTDLCGGLLLGYDFRRIPRPENAGQLARRVRELGAAGAAPVSLVACPLMHGTGMWVGAMIAMGLGGSVVTVPGRHFDADALWEAVVRERVTDITIVGDAFAKPMLAALIRAEQAGTPYDLSSLKWILSSGVMWTEPVKRALLERADMTLVDAMGSTEGSMGTSLTTRQNVSATAKFKLNPTSKVFDENDEEVKPGSGQIGRIANGGFVPIGYFKDEKKSAETFREIGGARYSLPGDYATVEADGTITLLGRGSACINTGGEKVFPEEVEEAVKSHSAVYDCLVVGVPDDVYGERVTAVVSLRPAQTASGDEITAAAREKLAGYKLPRSLILVEEVRRAANGKPDYAWAGAVAREALARPSPQVL
jgi:fatty-acyl-CoA synthase